MGVEISNFPHPRGSAFAYWSSVFPTWPVKLVRVLGGPSPGELAFCGLLKLREGRLPFFTGEDMSFSLLCSLMDSKASEQYLTHSRH